MRRIILGSALTFVLLVSSYLTVISTLELTTEKTLVRSVVLQGHEGSSSFVMLRMSDVLAMVAEVDSASNAYLLAVQDDIGEVFSRWGRINGSHVEVGVPLCPPSFEAGKSYVLFFHVYALNYPLPGATISDTRMVGFTVEASETRLDFEVGYDGIFRCLGLWANLTNADGCPVVDETVGFYMRPVSDRSRLTDGWIPIGSAKTNDDGTTSLSLAFNVSDGNYAFRAYHAGDENFGESENVTEVEISSDTAGGLCFGCESSFGKAFSSCDVGNLTITVSSDNPYALLQMNASAWYVVDEPLQGPYTFIFFFCDYMNITGFLGSSCASVSEGPPYVYKGSLGWCPEVVGHHELIAGVVSGTLYDIIAGMSGVGIRVSEVVDLEVQGCPSSLVVHYPQVVYNDVLSITTGFSMPRAYNVMSTDFYVAATLAPELTYNEVNYMVDEPVDSVPVKLYANGTLVSVNQTNEDGLAFFSLGLDFSDTHFASNITAVVDGAVLFESLTVERFVSFTRVGVSDVPSGRTDFFQLNYTLNGLDSQDGVYVGTDNLLKADVSLFDRSVWNVPVSVTSARFVSSCKTQMNPLKVGSIPTGSDYLRVTSFYDTKALVADIIRDGKVNLYDAVAVNTAYGSRPGDPNWNPDADIATPWKYINLYDSVIVLNYYGKSGVYYPPQGLYILFDNGQRVDVDSSGCARIPSGATSFTVYKNGKIVGAIVQFFAITFDETCWTNNIGTVTAVWKPMEIGTYLLQVKLPSGFNATTTFWSEVTEVDASLNIVDYYLVEKRPLDLSVDYVPEEPSLDDEVTMIANVFDLGLGEPADDLKVEFYVCNIPEEEWLYMGYSRTNSSGVATFTWTPSDYLEETGGLAYFLLLVRVVETAYTAMAEEVPVSVDTRYLTGLEFLMGGDAINIAVEEESHLYVKLVRADDGSPVNGVYVNLYIDGVKTSWALTGATGVPGVAEWWPWVVEEEGVYYYTARFENWNVLYQPSNEARLVVVAEVIPMNILFDVQPRDFKPGTSLTLTAQVNDSRSGEPLSDRVVKFYAVDEDGDKARIDDGSIKTDENGVATLTWTYVLGPYAFVAEVATGQSMMSSPVMLTVAKETGLSLNVEKSESGYEYTFSGCLLSYGDPVPYRQVKILVNDTVEAVLATNPDGSFSLTLDLQPADNKLTEYNVQAVFEGDEPCSATAYAFTPNGTEYAVCTTIQYGFKPASNSTWLSVEPQSTQVMQPTKTPKQLQAEAENSGWLSVYSEWSWWYPWYRLHVKMDINPTIDVGFNPILPGGETWLWDGLDFFEGLTEEVISDILLDVAGLFGGYLIARKLSIANPALGLALEIAKLATQSILLYISDWQTRGTRLLGSSIASIMMGLLAININIAKTFVDTLIRLCKWISSAMMNLFTILMNILSVEQLISRWWMDAIEISGDFLLGGLGILRYLGGI